MMIDQERIDYLEARVDALETVINNVINFYQFKFDRCQYNIPSDANFWCDQMQQLRDSINRQLNDNFPQE